uniref:Uncharacterized protein n=1 Tax=Sphaerodactylus townsendi TaxID=933632 RepID=A0ACB8E9Z5_9SAUR
MGIVWILDFDGLTFGGWGKNSPIRRYELHHLHQSSQGLLPYLFRNLPRAIFISIPLVTFVYTFTNIAYFTAMSPQELLSSNAVAVTFGEKLLGYFSWVMPVSVALSTFGGINGYLFTSSRLCFSGAREGHLPSLLAMIHVKHCTPIPALLVCCLATVIIMLVGETYTLINYVSFINYLCYGVTIIGLIVLRWKKPKVFRPIKVKNIGAM